MQLVFKLCRKISSAMVALASMLCGCSGWRKWGDRASIIVVIMIKSSDPHLSNTYRIIRVLSTHDYLATDHLRSHFIFSHIPRPEPSPIPATQHQFLLNHKEIIEIDNMHYAVFAVGAKEVVWAPLMPRKKAEAQKFVWRQLRQAFVGILKELLWMGSMQARKYMDLKNFWVVGDDLKVLLLPRQAAPKFAIKKSETRSTSGDKSLEHLMQAERSLMKQFAIIMWQICFQSSYYDDKNMTNHARSRHLLRQMVAKSISFEELCHQLSKQSIQTIYNKKSKFKSFQKDLLPRRKTVSFIDHSRISNQTLDFFYMHANTETLKRPYNTVQRQQSTIYQPTRVETEPRADHIRNSILENISSNNSIRFRKSRYAPKPFQSSSKDTIHFQRWLQSRKYSVQTKQKLIRNGEIARKKYSQAIGCRRDVAKEEKFDDSGFKERILQKVIKFKNAIQLNKAHPSSFEQTFGHEQIQKNVEVSRIQTQKLPQVLVTEHSIQKNNEQSCLKPVQDQTLRHEPNLRKNTPEKQPQIKQTPKIDNDYIHTLKQKPKQAQISKTKTQKKKLSRVDVFANPTQNEEDLQEIKLSEPGLDIPPPKKHPNKQEESKQKTIKQQSKQQSKQKTKQQTKHQASNQPPPPSIPPESNKNSVILLNPREAVGQLLLLVNTLGDMSVRAVKLKDKLNDLNWRQITYFIYERFHHERERIAGCLSRGEIVCRAHRKVDYKEWQQYLQREREEVLSQMKKDNEQITATLQRLGHKLLEQETLQLKIQYFVRNRQKIKKDSKLRGQLSRFIVSSLVTEFDFVWQERVQKEEILKFMSDCSFGMFVIGQLDSMLAVGKFARLQQYKQYNKDLTDLKSAFDCIDAVYFPKQTPFEVL